MATTHASRGRNDRTGMDEFRDAAAEIKQDLQHLGSACSHTARDSLSAVRGTAAQFYDRGRARAMALEQSVENQIRERPLQSTLLAAGCGFLAGMLSMLLLRR
jgi:ElaB/YqjD/DUF883 family membrane-anchored ribosome-binding protein